MFIWHAPHTPVIFSLLHLFHFLFITFPTSLWFIVYSYPTINTIIHLLIILNLFYKKIFPDFPILVSTRDLHNRLSLDSRFQATLDRGKGRIVVSPRTTNTFGHTGVFMDDDSIASNDSNSGKFVINYTWNSWIREFRDRRKLRIFIYL